MCVFVQRLHPAASRQGPSDRPQCIGRRYKRYIAGVKKSIPLSHW
jgi:hypothetical protein